MNFFIGSGLNGDRLDLLFIRVEIHRSVGLADGLEHTAVGFAGFGIGAARRSEAVDDQIDLTHVVANLLDHLLLDLVGKCVAVDGFGPKPFFTGSLFQRNGVIPAR